MRAIKARGVQGAAGEGADQGSDPLKTTNFCWGARNGHAKRVQKGPFLADLFESSACARRALDPGPYLWYTWVVHPPYV